MAKLKLDKPIGDPEVTATLKHELDIQRYVVYGIVVVVVALLISTIFTLGGIMTSLWAQKQASYEQLENQVHDQNSKIDALTQAIQNQQKSATSSTTVVH